MRVSFPARNADDDNITTRFHSIFVIHFLRGAGCLNACPLSGHGFLFLLIPDGISR
ncbi:hypothetical protein [Citrobacter braakii]|jgi:hypothetical protein|uniref:hypothetical protein n=1 Tax=Citrobacter braakii TaxID=57706 RepID=UPI0013F17A74|nr:hypothetical protein [Citrobacter braakii]HAT7504240.1 hypothetical protein [Citrobacter braakii]